MPPPRDLAEEATQRLREREQKTALHLVRSYTAVLKTALADLEHLQAMIADRIAEGLEVGEGWLHRERRLQELIRSVAVETARFVGVAEPLITADQKWAVELATETAQRQIEEGIEASDRLMRAGVSFVRPPQEALSAFVGTLADGAPVRTLLLSIAQDVADVAMAAGNPLKTLPFDMAGNAGRVLLRGISQGLHPRQVADDLARTLGAGLDRSLTIARTEMLRSHRRATQENYLANDNVVTGWTRLEFLDVNTCAVCWALHGRKHKNSDIFRPHPNCRGTMVPDMEGIPDDIEPGEELFDQLSAAEQEEVLGPKKFKAWKEGRFELRHLVKETEHERWGPGVREASLDDTIAAAQASPTLADAGRGNRRGFHAPDLIPTAPKSIDEALNRVQGRPTERVWAFPAEGKPFHVDSKPDSPDEVDLTPYAERLRRGKTAHNHTDEWLFSARDLRASVNLDLAENWIVTPSGKQFGLRLEPDHGLTVDLILEIQRQAVIDSYASIPSDGNSAVAEARAFQRILSELPNVKASLIVK